jgi:Nif-specific regulatory protein
LANVIERMVLLADHSSLGAQDIERYLPSAEQPLPAGSESDWPAQPIVRPYARVESHSAEVLRVALERSGGNKSRAAQSLGLTARQFNYRWQKLNGADSL